MVDFIDDNRMEYGVEPICNTLPIAPSTYCLHEARKRNPDLEPERTRRGKTLKAEIQRIWDDNRKVYGAMKICEAFKKMVGRCSLHCRASDALYGPQRCHSWHRDQDNLLVVERRQAGGSGQPGLHRNQAEPAVGCRFYPCFNVARFRLWRLHH